METLLAAGKELSANKHSQADINKRDITGSTENLAKMSLCLLLFWRTVNEVRWKLGSRGSE